MTAILFMIFCGSLAWFLLKLAAGASSPIPDNRGIEFAFFTAAISGGLALASYVIGLFV